MVTCKMPSNRRGVTLSVVVLGSALCAVMLAYFVFGDTNDEQGLRTLRMIFVLSRHGDRSPTELYPNDPHINYEWPGGLGALSEKGTLQMYNGGKNLHMRYFRLLPSNGLYTKEEVFILSSAAERCLMSAQSLLAGFMPPLTNRNVLPIQWQPIPVNSVPRDRDYLIAQKKPCPNYDNILKRLYMNPPQDVKEMNAKNAAMYQYLTKHTGQNISNILDVELLYNTLEIEQNNGLQLPDWTESVFPEKMLPIAERSYTLFTETALMKKVKGGALVTEIYDNMVKKRNVLTPDRKIFLYLVHDVTLVNIMNSMNILDQTSRKPSYAATLVFELHHSVIFEDDFEVKLVYYFDSEDRFPKEISIPNCSSPCSLTEFGRSVEHLLLRNYDETCGIFQ